MATVTITLSDIVQGAVDGGVSLSLGADSPLPVLKEAPYIPADSATLAQKCALALLYAAREGFVLHSENFELTELPE